MSTQTFLMGPITDAGATLLPVPFPESGMDWKHNRDAKETELVSGGRHTSTRPTPYKSYSVQWKGGTAGLQNVIDLYSGVYGRGPFYLLDPNHDEAVAGAGNVNLLPTRWATASMLAYVNGHWCNATEVSGAGLDGRASSFVNPGTFPQDGVPQTVLMPQGSTAHLRVWGSASGGSGVLVEKLVGGTWSEVGVCAPDGNDFVVGAVTAVRLTPRVPSGGNLTLAHASLTTGANSSKLPGRGVGAVSFGSALSGNIVTRRFDRIGLALDIVENEQ